MPKKYTAEFEAEVAHYVEQFGRGAAAEFYSLTSGQVGGLVFRYKAALKNPKLFDVKIAEADPLLVEGDVMIIGDVHVPTTDYELARRMQFVALNYLKPPRQLIVAGDLFNLDFMSIYPPIRRETAWKQEKRAARALFREWLTIFDKVVFIAGNHDRRLEKATGGHFSMEDLIDLVTHDKRVIVSEWGHCVLRSGDREFRVTHGRNYSVNAGSVGNDLAHKYQQNIISHHQHQAFFGMDRFKRFIVIDNAALVDPGKLAYATLDDSKMPGMARGFCMVRRGEPTLFVEGVTVWDNWLPRGGGQLRRHAPVAASASK